MRCGECQVELFGWGGSLEIWINFYQTIQLTLEDFFNTNDPNYIVMGILVFERVGEPEAKIVIDKLASLGLDKDKLYSYICDVFELAIRRKGRAAVEQVFKNMSFIEKELILEDPFYLQGLELGLKEGKEEGLVEGEKKGLEEGEKKGIMEGKILSALGLYRQNFTFEQIRSAIEFSDSEWQMFLNKIPQV